MCLWLVLKAMGHVGGTGFKEHILTDEIWLQYIAVIIMPRVLCTLAKYVIDT